MVMPEEHAGRDMFVAEGAVESVELEIAAARMAVQESPSALPCGRAKAAG